MKRFTVLILAVAMIAMVAGSAFALANPTVVRGSYNYATPTPTTLTSTTAAVVILSTGSYPYYVDKTFTIYNPTGGTTTLFTIEGSADNSHWFTIDATGTVAAAGSDYYAVVGTVLPYFRIRGIVVAASTGISTPECSWFGTTN